MATNYDYFQDNSQDMFQGVSQEALTPYSQSPNNTKTALVAGVAGLATQDPSSPDETASMINQNIESSKSLLDNQQEYLIRLQSASRQIMQKNEGLKGLKNSLSGFNVPKELSQSIDTGLYNNMNQDVEQAAKTSLENEAIDQIHSKLATGDDVDARILYRNLTGNGQWSDVQRDFATKNMIIAQELEKAGVDADNESWLHYFMSGAVNFGAELYANSTFAQLGNVDSGKGGYTPSWHRFFTPASEMENQGAALYGMSPQQLRDYMPQLIENLRGNATTLGIYDPAKYKELLGQLGGQSREQVLKGNLWSGANVALIAAPLVKRILSPATLIAGLGARKAAASVVNNAYEQLAKDSEAKAVSITGLNATDITDSMLPSAINPSKSAAIDAAKGISSKAELMSGTSLSSAKPDFSAFDPVKTIQRDVNAQREGINRVTDMVKEWGLLGNNARLSEDEMQQGIKGALDEVTRRAGTEPVDHDFGYHDFADGNRIPYVDFTFGPHASTDEALNFLRSNGFESAEGNVSHEITTLAERKIYPKDEGFTTRAYHGTDETFQNFDKSFGGKVTATGDGASYFTDEPDVAFSYSREAALNNEYNRNPVSDSKSAGFGNIRPVDINLNNFHEVDMHGAGYVKDMHDDLIQEGRDLGKDGVIFHNYDDSMSGTVPHPSEGSVYAPRQSTIYAVFDPDKSVRSALQSPRIERDMSSAYFPKVRMYIPENGFYTPGLEPGPQGAFSKLWTSSRQLDSRLFGSASVSNNNRNRLQKLVQKNLTAPFKGLDKNDRAWLEQIILKGTNLSKWFNDDEFSSLWERATGKAPTEKVIANYKQFIDNNNVEWALRNIDAVKSKALRGYESVRFSVQGQPVDIDGIVRTTQGSVPNARIYDLTNDTHLIPGTNELTQARWEELRSQGYQLIQTEQPIKLPDGTRVKQFLAHKGDVEISPLRMEQLAYSEGGHRMYAGKYFAKQAQVTTQPDTGEKFLMNPNVFMTGATMPDVSNWVGVMERARNAVKNLGADAKFLDNNIFKSQKGFPTGSEFMDKVESGFISLDHPFEAMYDREMPTAYRSDAFNKTLVDENEVGFGGYYRTTGKMYYSAKGEHLPDHTGDPAPTLDPFESQARALYNVANLSSFSDFKTSAIERWLKTYGEDGANAIKTEGGSSMQRFINAKVNTDLPLQLQRQANNQKQAIERIMNFRTPWDRQYDAWMRGMSEFIVGDGMNPTRKWAGQKVFWLQDHNPVNFLRGLAFDAKLGMFNVGQLITQTSTMFSALALNPEHGKFGLASALPVWSYFLSKGNEAVLDRLSKAGVWKLAGMSSEKEFKDYVRFAQKTGFFDLGDTHVMVNNYGPHTTFGSFSGGIEGVREMGRLFFYNAEVLNRLVSHRIAYGEALSKFGSAQFDNPEFRAFMAGRAENYSFNMSEQSSAWWQKGVMSIPTQFAAYNIRMLEAMTGSNFTAAQKLKLALFNLGAYGTAGLPVAAGVGEWVKERYGVTPDIGTFMSIPDRGVADNLIYGITGVDAQFSERWGTGQWYTDFVKSIFGTSQYGDKSIASVLGGPTFEIMGGVFGPAIQAAWAKASYYSGMEKGNEPIDMSNDQWIDMAKQVSSLGNGIKAYMVYNYGVYKSNTGTILATDIPSQDAFAVALGFRPSQLEWENIRAFYEANKQDVIDDAAKQLRNWRQESLAQPDTFVENAKKANAFMQTLPLNVRAAVQAKTNKITDDSFYSGLARQEQKEDVQDQIMNSLDDNNSEDNDGTVN